MKLKNVLDQLTAIAETNDSEDVARAIATTNAYSFKDRLTIAERVEDSEGASDAGMHWDEDMGRYIDDEEPGSGSEIDRDLEETPGDDDDQYCALCGNTGYRLDQSGVACPNCSEGDGEAKAKEDREIGEMGKNAGIEGACGDEDAIEGDGDADEAFDRIADRVASRNGDGLGDDPWGMGGEGEGEDELMAGADPDSVPDDVQMNKAGSALDRVQQRAQRSGEGGPLDRLNIKKEEKYAALEEEMGRVFQTPMERHSWIMNQLNDMTSDMTPEDAQMVKSLLKTAGSADVKGGNC